MGLSLPWRWKKALQGLELGNRHWLLRAPEWCDPTRAHTSAQSPPQGPRDPGQDPKRLCSSRVWDCIWQTARPKRPGQGELVEQGQSGQSLLLLLGGQTSSLESPLEGFVPSLAVQLDYWGASLAEATPPMQGSLSRGLGQCHGVWPPMSGKPGMIETHPWLCSHIYPLRDALYPIFPNRFSRHGACLFREK